MYITQISFATEGKFRVPDAQRGQTNQNTGVQSRERLTAGEGQASQGM